jgi:hypothetical protein
MHDTRCGVKAVHWPLSRREKDLVELVCKKLISAVQNVPET